MKRRTAKKGGSSRQRRGRSNAGLYVLLSLLGLVAVLVALVFAMKETPIKHLQGQIVLSFGEHGSGKGQMDSPRGIALDASGNIYAVDLGNSRVNKYGPDGKFLMSWGKKGENPGQGKPGEFNEPSGLAVDPAGNVLVADAWNGRVQKFDSNGKFLQEFGGATYSFYSPRNVACDAQGNFYVADTGNSRLQIFSSDGGRLKILGERGHRKGLFDEVFGVAVNSRGEIFAADPGNASIHKYSALPEPKLVAEKTVPGWKRSRPFWPMLAIDKMDRVYASDNNNREIWVYDSNLDYLGTLGGEPTRDYFAGPLGVAIDPNGQLVVGDLAKNMILKFAPLVFPASK